MSFDKTAPTLGDLRWVFFAIVQVLEQYELLGVCANPLPYYLFVG